MAVIKWFVITLVFFFIVASVPFISFQGDNYDNVITDVTHLYNLENVKIEVIMSSGRVLNASTNQYVNGTHERDIRKDGEGNLEVVHVISIQKSASRPWTIANIFHEFAHAAQDEYNLIEDGKSAEGYTEEQHAEMMTFDTLWRSKYWWNALHMLTMHSLHFKPDGYLLPGKMWNTFFTGQRNVILP